MKSTGIVRRIDDLGRIVIPKEIRRTLNLKEGDPLEYGIVDGVLYLQKYYAGNGYKEMIERLISNINDDFDLGNSAEIKEKLSEALALLKARNDET